LRHLRHAFRGLRAERTFALTAILTLALGVGTVTTIFSVADAELWKPLPYPEPERLIVAYLKATDDRRALSDPLSGADLQDWRRDATAFAELAGLGRTTRRVLSVSDGAQSVIVSEVSANYFTMFGRTAAIGRTFTPEDARGSQSVVITSRAWKRLFASDPGVVGKAMTLDERPIVVAGVVLAENAPGLEADLFLPLDESAPSFGDRSTFLTYGAFGRLKPGVDAGVAREQLQASADRIAAANPASGRSGHVIFVENLQRYYLASYNRPLYYFLGASLVVLLLSAVNVATLLQGRAVRRVREFALRGALGGSVTTLARQLLAEGGLIAVPGGALGVLLATLSLRLFQDELPGGLLQRTETAIPVDLRVAAFAAALTALATMVCAMVPLLMARRIDLSVALGSGGRTGRSTGEGRARLVLLTAQIALTVVLLFGAGIFMKSFVKLTQVPLGFDPAGAVAVRATLSGPRYATDAQLIRYADDLLAQARALPGVVDAAVGSNSPLGSGPLVRFAVAGRPRPEINDTPRAILKAASPAYFRTLGMRLVKGRAFSDTDVAGAPRVAIVNEHLASVVFPGEDPIGRTIELAILNQRVSWTNRPGPTLIVGIVQNVKEVSINEVPFSNIFMPFAQTPAPSVELQVRAGVPMATLAGPLRRMAASIDPAIPITSVTTFDQRVTNALQGDRFNFLLTAAFAVIAVLLAGIGVYGAVSYAVESRTREFGVRLAFGARAWMLVVSALWQAGRVGAIGGIAGLLTTLALGRLIGDALYLVPGAHNGLLYGVSTSDPAMLGTALAGVIGVALIAGVVPARRVSSLDPVVALRSD
jgi:putative ABC transport system permease protein